MSHVAIATSSFLACVFLLLTFAFIITATISRHSHIYTYIFKHTRVSIENVFMSFRLFAFYTFFSSSFCCSFGGVQHMLELIARLCCSLPLFSSEALSCVFFFVFLCELLRFTLHLMLMFINIITSISYLSSLLDSLPSSGCMKRCVCVCMCVS